MPVYVYECSLCGHRFEAIQGINEEPRTICPCYECKGSIDEEGYCTGKVRRVIQPVGIAFKGSGFHNTDYNKTGRNPTKYSDYTK